MFQVLICCSVVYRQRDTQSLNWPVKPLFPRPGRLFLYEGYFAMESSPEPNDDDDAVLAASPVKPGWRRS